MSTHLTCCTPRRRTPCAPPYATCSPTAATRPAVLARTESDAPHDAALWKALAADMGLAGLLVPEKLGGQGATHREAAVVLEELGRAVAPVPYLTSAVLATEALLALRQPTTCSRGWRRDCTIGALAVGLHSARRRSPSPRPYGSTDGAACHAASSPASRTLPSPMCCWCPTADGGLYAVDAARPASPSPPRSPLDLTRPLAAVTLAGAAGRRSPRRTRGRRRAAAPCCAGAGLLASEQLGLAEWCLTETVRHTRGAPSVQPARRLASRR